MKRAKTPHHTVTPDKNVVIKQLKSGLNLILICIALSLIAHWTLNHGISKNNITKSGSWVFILTVFVTTLLHPALALQSLETKAKRKSYFDATQEANTLFYILIAICITTLTFKTSLYTPANLQPTSIHALEWLQLGVCVVLMLTIGIQLKFGYRKENQENENTPILGITLGLIVSLTTAFTNTNQIESGQVTARQVQIPILIDYLNIQTASPKVLLPAVMLGDTPSMDRLLTSLNRNNQINSKHEVRITAAALYIYKLNNPSDKHTEDGIDHKALISLIKGEPEHFLKQIERAQTSPDQKLTELLSLRLYHALKPKIDNLANLPEFPDKRTAGSSYIEQFRLVSKALQTKATLADKDLLESLIDISKMLDQTENEALI